MATKRFLFSSTEGHDVVRDILQNTYDGREKGSPTRCNTTGLRAAEVCGGFV